MSQKKKQNDGVRDPSPIKKSTSASPITTQASTAAASISASTPSQSSTVVVAKGTRGSAFGARTVPTGTSGASGGAESHCPKYLFTTACATDLILTTTSKWKKM